MEADDANRNRRSRSGTKPTQIKFRAPNQLAELLEQAAEQNQHGLSEEIRQRLETSFSRKPDLVADDPKIREATAAISWILRGYSLAKSGDSIGHWYDDPEAFWIVRAAVREILDRLRPEGADPNKPGDEGGAALYAAVALSQVRGEL